MKKWISKDMLRNNVDLDSSLKKFGHTNHFGDFLLEWYQHQQQQEIRNKEERWCIYVSFWFARDEHTLHILQDFTRTQTICHTHSLHLHKYISLDEVEWEFLAWIVWEIEKGRDGTWLNLWAWTTQSW